MNTLFNRTARSQSPHRSSRRAAPLLCITGLLFIIALVCGKGQAGELTVSNPNQIKSAYLRNFAHYVTWPATAFANTTSPWNIGILGDDSFGGVLEETLKGRVEQKRSFRVFRADTLKDLPSCQIIFIAYQDAAKRRAVLKELQGQPVLTVGDAAGFLQEGGIIQFQVKDRVEMSINLDQSGTAALTIPTKMLEVAREVLENGKPRKLR